MLRMGPPMKMSDNLLHFPDAERLEERAAEWAVRVAEGDLSEEEKAAFQSWYAASARHREAFSRLAQLWGHCDALAELADHAAADVTVESLDAGGLRRSGVFRYLPGRRTFLAASVALIALLGARTLEQRRVVTARPPPADVYETVAETSVGERRTVTFPDGSSVELNTASRLTVRYAANARVVQLTRGEAYFTVASDPQRPFSVHAADRVVTAIGTAFTVQLRRDAVEVTVAQGRVRLAESRPTKAGSASPEPEVSLPPLEAGQSALLHEGLPQVAALAPEDLERKLAWRQGMLDFAGEPLGQVLEEIGRYTQIDIEVTDPTLRELPVAGRLRINDVESMLEALQLMADVRVERVDERHARVLARNRR